MSTGKIVIEFPKMLYRLGAEPNENVGGLRLDTKTVYSKEEQTAAVKSGWIVEYSVAVERLNKSARRTAKVQNLRIWWERWEWAVKAGITLVGLAAAGAALLKAL